MIVGKLFLLELLNDAAKLKLNLSDEESNELFSSKGQKIPKKLRNNILNTIGNYVGMNGKDLRPTWSLNTDCKSCPCSPGYTVRVIEKALCRQSEQLKEQTYVHSKNKLRFELTQNGKLFVSKTINNITENLSELELL
jgi:hypothetical protein